jgi:hypothetical protein
MATATATVMAMATATAMATAMAMATATATATAMAMATATAMDKRTFHLYNNLVGFSDYLASFLASAHSEVHQKERKMGLLLALQIWIRKYTNKKMVFCLRICISGHKTPVLQNRYANASF